MTSHYHAASSDKVFWVFRICINTGQFSQWLPKDLEVPGTQFLNGTCTANFFECFFRVLQQHTPIMAQEQSTESKTESSLFVQNKHRNLIIFGQSQIKKRFVSQWVRCLVLETLWVLKSILLLFFFLACYVNHRGQHNHVAALLAESLLLSTVAWQCLREWGLGCALESQNGVTGNSPFGEKKHNPALQLFIHKKN